MDECACNTVPTAVNWSRARTEVQRDAEIAVAITVSKAADYSISALDGVL